MGKLEGKVAIVTGASRSLGKAMAIGLAQEGANLVLAARTLDSLKQTGAAVLACGVQAEVAPTDVTVEAQVESLFARTLARFGRLDILVNNAGLFSNAPIDEIPTEDWDKMIALICGDLSVPGAFRIMKNREDALLTSAVFLPSA
jgi:NAD(P)-dependent dehydrogenase (short-subunit alcohol dehydrogenase family)